MAKKKDIFLLEETSAPLLVEETSDTPVLVEELPVPQSNPKSAPHGKPRRSPGVSQDPVIAEPNQRNNHGTELGAGNNATIVADCRSGKIVNIIIKTYECVAAIIWLILIVLNGAVGALIHTDKLTSFWFTSFPALVTIFAAFGWLALVFKVDEKYPISSNTDSKAVLHVVGRITLKLGLCAIVESLLILLFWLLGIWC